MCIDKDGKASVYGDFSETRPFKAVAIYKIEASVDGGGSFDLSNFRKAGAAGGKWYWGWVDNGVLRRTIND